MNNATLLTLTIFGCGIFFAAFKLPVLTPSVFAGVAGIVDLCIGFKKTTKVIS